MIKPIKPFEKATSDKGDSLPLDAKIAVLDKALEDLGWAGTATEYRRIVDKKHPDLSSDNKKLRVIDYLTVYLKFKKEYPNEGDIFLSTLVADEISEKRTDTLTNIYNRRAFDDDIIIEQKNLETQTNRAKHSVYMLLDLNDFKSINDTIGHEAGDEALIHFSQTVGNVLRKEDRFYRTGGDEFSLILPNADAHDVQAISDKIKKALKASPFQYAGHNMALSASIGAADIKPDKEISESLKQADVAMYEDKKAHKSAQKNSGVAAGRDGRAARAPQFL